MIHAKRLEAPEYLKAFLIFMIDQAIVGSRSRCWA